MTEPHLPPARPPLLVRLVPWGLVLLSLLGAGVLVQRWHSPRDWIETDDAFVVGNVLTLAAQASGTVVAIETDTTREVSAGQVLVRLDATRARLDLAEARAALAEAVRKVAGQFAEVKRAQAACTAARAGIARLEHDLQRFREGVKDEAVAPRQLQNAEDKAVELRASLARAEADLAVAAAQVEGTTVRTHPTVLRAIATLQRRALEVARSEIAAPTAGVIAKRRVQLGDVVQPGTPLLALVPAAPLWVEANLKETQIEGLAPGKAAELEISTRSGLQRYHGVVEGVQPGTGSVFALLPPENASGNFIHIVERLPVRIAFDPQELAAHPVHNGLSVAVRIRRHQSTLLPIPAAPTYATTMFNDELKDIDKDIEGIISHALP